MERQELSILTHASNFILLSYKILIIRFFIRKMNNGSWSSALSAQTDKYDLRIQFLQQFISNIETSRINWKRHPPPYTLLRTLCIISNPLSTLYNSPYGEFKSETTWNYIFQRCILSLLILSIGYIKDFSTVIIVNNV